MCVYIAHTYITIDIANAHITIECVKSNYIRIGKYAFCSVVNIHSVCTECVFIVVVCKYLHTILL